MRVPKELLGVGVCAAGLLQAIINPITTFGASWTYCNLGVATMEWGMQSCTVWGINLDYDTSFTSAMAQANENFRDLMTGCTVIEILNVVAMCLGLFAAMAGGFGGFASRDEGMAEACFQVSVGLLVADVFLRLVGVLAWLFFMIPAIADMDLAVPLKHFGIELPFVKCAYHNLDFGMIGTAIEIVILFNVILVVGLLGKSRSSASARDVQRGREAVQMMNLHAGQPQGYGFPPGPGPSPFPARGQMQAPPGRPPPPAFQSSTSLMWNQPGMPPSWGSAPSMPPMPPAFGQPYPPSPRLG